MNFISEMDLLEISVELKYCERCGGLWLRQQGTEGVYCSGCRLCLAAMPDPGEAPPRKVRKRREAISGKRDVQLDTGNADSQESARIDCLQGVAEREVWA